MVFINPAVARLPKHDHLLSEAGCFYGSGVADCKGEDKLTPQYSPLPGAAKPDLAWYSLVWPNNVPRNADHEAVADPVVQSHDALDLIALHEQKLPKPSAKKLALIQSMKALTASTSGSA